ncbi:peptidylprolyl isomerase SurA [Thorsellia anophelis]|uniref:Chaperone SurA n=1 Tax=Thorsellia anophelis DSM 18579 TaxID=1123402 RepID=A0A1I0ABL8_9GAMM|nr:peptidylprolyl isomerase SurA [Thorsellia anophelis]SES91120.1 peptidyl-prolyl cis-trans isomerase SurA [Thorsellia anophelis DSM 18579]
MKKIHKILLVSLVCGQLFSQIAYSAPVEMNSIAAIVNDSVVLQGDVEKMLANIKANAVQSNQQLPDDERLRKQILDRLIAESIQMQIADKRGIKITDESLDAAIADIAMRNGISVGEMQAHLESQGISYSSYRAQVRKDIKLNQVQSIELGKKIRIPDAEVESLAKQISAQNIDRYEVNLSHILIALPQNPSALEESDGLELAIEIINQVKNGGDFAKLAYTYSADAQALDGGQMGWGKVEELPPFFAEKLTSPTKGQIIGPLRSPIGYHILKVNDARSTKQVLNVTEVNARHILVKTSPVFNAEQARAKLKDIADQIKAGTLTFEQAAKQYSEDPGSAQKGGELGWSNVNAYDPGFADGLLRLSKNQLSEPIESSFGFHLIELLDKRSTDKTEEGYKDRAREIIFNRKLAQEAQMWERQLRAGAYIKITDGYVKE